MAPRSPRAANARAMALPMPREAPVTRTARAVTGPAVTSPARARAARRTGPAARGTGPSLVQLRHEPPRPGRGDLFVVGGHGLPLVRAEARVERLAVGEVQLGLPVVGLLSVDGGHEPGGLGPLQARDLAHQRHVLAQEAAVEVIGVVGPGVQDHELDCHAWQATARPAAGPGPAPPDQVTAT